MKNFKDQKCLGLDSIVDYKLDRMLGQSIDDFIYIDVYLKLREMKVIMLRNEITEQLHNEELNED